MIFPKCNQRRQSLPSRVDILETFVNLILFSSQFGIIPIKHLALSLIPPISKRLLKTIDYCLDKEAWQDSGLYKVGIMEEFVHFFKEAGCMQVQLWVLIVDPLTTHGREKVMLWGHGVGAQTSYLLTSRSQWAVSGWETHNSMFLDL